MIADHTKSAILAILAVDDGVTDAERRAIANVLAGHRIHPGGLIKLTDASKRLGVHYNTVRKLVKAGRLSPIKGTGSVTIGISEESLERLLEGERK